MDNIDSSTQTSGGFVNKTVWNHQELIASGCDDDLRSLAQLAEHATEDSGINLAAFFGNSAPEPCWVAVLRSPTLENGEFTMAFGTQYGVNVGGWAKRVSELYPSLKVTYEYLAGNGEEYGFRIELCNGIDVKWEEYIDGAWTPEAVGDEQGRV